jgi:hypothetical protein
MMMIYIKKNIRKKIPLLLCCLFLFFNSRIAFPEAENKSSQVRSPGSNSQRCEDWLQSGSGGGLGHSQF